MDTQEAAKETRTQAVRNQWERLELWRRESTAFAMRPHALCKGAGCLMALKYVS